LGTRHQAIGRSRGGLTGTNIAVCDALGYLVRFVFVSGQASDLTGTDALLAGLDFGALIADRAFDVGLISAYPHVAALSLKTAAWRNTGNSGMHSPQGSGSQRPVSPRGQCRLSKKDHYQ